MVDGQNGSCGQWLQCYLLDDLRLFLILPACYTGTSEVPAVDPSNTVLIFRLQVTPISMNWSAAVFGGFVIIGLVWYAVLGRKQYHGPIVERPMLVTDEVK